jgi:hypothetical protein
MARITMGQRRALPKSRFGLPEKAPGVGSYPMRNRRQAGVAKAYATRFATPSEKVRIDAKANQILGKTGSLGYGRRGR